MASRCAMSRQFSRKGFAMRKIEQRIVNAVQQKKEFQTAHDGVYHYADGGWAVDLLGTKVVLFTPKEKGIPLSVVLRTGGYQTVTTRSRMNAALRLIDPALGIYQKKHEWFITGINGKVSPFIGNTMLLQRVRGKWKATPVTA